MKLRIVVALTGAAVLVAALAHSAWVLAIIAIAAYVAWMFLRDHIRRDPFRKI
jgi:hypothetical protein